MGCQAQPLQGGLSTCCLHMCQFGLPHRWHPTPVFLAGESQGRGEPGGLPSVGSNTDMTERLHFDFSLSCIGEGNGNPLQCSCLENPRDSGAWWAAVCGVAQSQTRLKRLSSSIAGQLGARSKYLRGELGTSQETCLPWPCLRCYRYRCVSVTSPLKFKGRAPTGLLFWSEQCQSSIVRGICGMGEMIATIFGKYNLPEHVSESMFFWYLKMGKNIYSP